MSQFHRDLMYIFVLSFLMFVAGTVLFQPSALQAQETIHWDYLVYNGLETVIGGYYQEFAEKVKDRTSGRLEITVRPPGELPYSALEMLRVVGRGSVEMGDAYPGFIGGDVPIARLPLMPMLVHSEDELVTTVNILRPYLNQELKKRGASVLFWYDWDTQHLWGPEEPVRTLDDLEGMKIRATSNGQMELLRRLGASPISLTTKEVPTAMNRGVMDALLTSGFSAYGSRWGDLFDWGYLLPVNSAPSFTLVNTEAYEALPPDLQNTLSQAASEFQQRLIEEINARAQDDLKRLENEFNIQLIEPSPGDVQKAQALIKDYWTTWAEEEVGPDGEEALRKVREALGR